MPDPTTNWSGFTDRELPLPGEPIPGRFGYRRVPAADYHAFPALNAGLLKCRTAAEMHAHLTAEHKDTDALTTGTLVHMVTLEPETSWKEKFAVADIPINPTTGNPYGADSKKGKAAWEAARADNPGKIIVTPETFREYMEECKQLQLALMCNADAMGELADVETEITGILWHPRWNCWVKWRPDIMPRHCRYLADVKTTSRHVADFSKDAWQYGYYLQAAFYAHCHELLLARMNLTVTKFPFIVLSKADESRYPRPAMCRVYDLPMDGALNRGVAMAKSALGLPEGFSRVDMFLDCCREHVAAGCPTEFRAVRKIWPAYENEVGEKGRWVLAD
jgi:hypothetical protein